MVPTHRDRFRGALSGYFLGPLYLEQQAELQFRHFPEHRTTQPPLSSPPNASSPSKTLHKREQQLQQLQKQIQIITAQQQNSNHYIPSLDKLQEKTASANNVQQLLLMALPRLLLLSSRNEDSDSNTTAQFNWLDPTWGDSDSIENSSSEHNSSDHDSLGEKDNEATIAQLERHLGDRIASLLKGNPPSTIPSRQVESLPLNRCPPSALAAIFSQAESCFVNSQPNFQLALANYSKWHRATLNKTKLTGQADRAISSSTEAWLNDIQALGAQFIGIWFGTALGHQAFPLTLKQQLGDLYPSLLASADHLYAVWTGQGDLQKVGVSYDGMMPISAPT